jgi:hypothetical protein
MSDNRFERLRRDETEAELAAPKFKQDFFPELRDRLLGEYRWRMIMLLLALGCLIVWSYWCWRADMNARSDYPNLDTAFNAMLASPCNHIFWGLAGLLLLLWANSPLGLHCLRNFPAVYWSVLAYWGITMVYLIYRLVAQALGWPAPAFAALLLQPLWLLPLALGIAEVREIEREVAGT